MRHLKKFVSNTSGATAIEYTLICTLISVVIITALLWLESPIDGLFGSVVEQFNSVETFMDRREH